MRRGRKKKAGKTPRTLYATASIIMIAMILVALMFTLNTANVQEALNAFMHPKTNATSYYCGIAVSEQQYNTLNSTGSYQFEGNPCHHYYINGKIGAFNTVLSGGIDGPVTLYNSILLVPLEPPTYNYTSPSYYMPNMSAMWGGLAAVNATTGGLIWQDNFTDPIMTQPLAVNGIVYVGSGSDFINTNAKQNGIFAINITNGQIVWEIKTTNQNMPTFVYYNDSIIKISNLAAPLFNASVPDGALQAFDPLTGDLKWQVSLNALVAMSSPVLVGNTIYLGEYYQNNTNRGVVYAINADTHKIVWSTFFPKGADRATQDTTLAIWNNTLIDGFAYTNPELPDQYQPTNLTLVGLDLTNGSIRWEFNEGVGVNTPRSMLPASTTYNNIAFTDTTEIGWLYALNMSTGKPLWKFHTGPSLPPPQVIDGYVFAENQTGTVFILDMNDTLYKTIDLGTPEGWCGSASIAQIGDKVVFGGDDGRLIVLPISSLIAPD
jgi:outer membrane protein assembly factor BamB